jgi:hypothetical protein
MGFLSRLFGGTPEPRDDVRRRGESPGSDAPSPAGQTADERAIARYRYLLRTAPPEAIEQAHAEAFAQLTPAQRRRVLEDLNRDLPPQERAAGDDPRSLARTATRAELRQPGTLERAFGGPPGGVGGFLAGSFLSTIAGVVVGTAVADALFGDGNYAEGYQDGVAAADADQGADAADAADAGDAMGDFGGVDFGAGES